MKYTSTRQSTVETDSAAAVIDGLSADGGLFVPKEFPVLHYADFLELDYAARCDRILKTFFDDFDTDGVCADAYAAFDGDPAPIVKLDENMFVLELWHGRTHAFKDMALSVLPRLIVRAKASKGKTDKTLILVATSGDTGKAALEGFRDVDGTACCVFYPTDGVSRVQKLAMQTQKGDNVCAVGITGNFDDAQSAVKAAFIDNGLNAALGENNISVSSANSINIGRLVPQIAYYFSAYCDLINAGEIKPGERIDFVVPTGNFGNILAGYYALRMGLPINKLVCASNRNNVLTDFIDSGTYDINREFYKTDSPSMDILISSNLERLIFEISGRDSELTKSRMEELKTDGRYSVTPSEIDGVKEIFAGDFADDEDIAEAIADVEDEYGYLIDTHTAAAFAVAMRREFVRPTVVVSTANPYKFAPAVMNALGERATGDADADMLRRLEEITAIEAPESLIDVFSSEIRFDDVISPSEIIPYIKKRYAKQQ